MLCECMSFVFSVVSESPITFRAVLDPQELESPCVDSAQGGPRDNSHVQVHRPAGYSALAAQEPWPLTSLVLPAVPTLPVCAQLFLVLHLILLMHL